MLGRTSPNRAMLSLYTWGDKVTGIIVPSPMYLIDVSGWRNPQTHGPFRNYPNGLDPKILEWMKEEPRIDLLSREIHRLAHMLLKGQAKTVNFLSVGIKDHYGQFIAPAVAELVARDLENHFIVGIRHVVLNIDSDDTIVH